MNDVTEYFNTVYEATFRELTRRCIQKAPIEDARDILQNTYAKFYGFILRRGAGAVRDPHAYLARMLKHEIARWHRSKAARQELPLEAAENEPTDCSVEDMGLDRAAAGEILACIEGESDATKRSFILYYGYGMQLCDIAKEMGTTEAGVKSRLLRVRKKIKTKLDQEDKKNEQDE